MKHKTPKQLLSCAIIFLSFTANSQFKLPLNNAFRNDVQKVVAEYPGQFAAIKGEVIEKHPQTTDYLSLVKPDGTLQATITQYSYNSKPVYSWQAVVLTTEHFDEAAKKYKWVFNQLRGLSVPYVVDKYTLEGTFEAPEESRKFSTSVLALIHPPSRLRKLKVEASMQFEFPEWKVLLTVYEKEKEDDESGEETDD